MDNQVSTKLGVQCGACKADNVPESKYCSGCGQSLYENCRACGKSVLLTQKFCGDCGADLEKLLQKRHRQHQQWMSDALSLAKEGEYDRAIEVLGRLVELTDYRFRETAADAANAIEKIEIIRDKTQNAAAKATKKAFQALEQGDHRQIVSCLEAVSANLLGDDVKKLLAKAKALMSESSSLETSVRTAISEKDWVQVGRLVQQLLALEPKRSRYQQLAQQVSEKLVAEARKALDDGRYESANESLNAVPEFAVTDEIRELQKLVENIYWLSEQFDSEPYATPLLGRRAVRLAKETPQNSRTQKLVKQLSQHLKQSPRAPRMHLPAWKGNALSWLGGEAKILGLPTCVDYQSAPEFKVAAGRFNIAVGLAMQGLGKSRITEDFLSRKRNLLSFGKRKNVTCWGLDVGTSTVKAVLLKATGSGLEVVDTFFGELDAPVSSRRGNGDDQTALRPVIERFLKEKQPGETPVWANLSASFTVNRFLRLPPVKDKEAGNLMQKDVLAKIPVSKDELVAVTWVHELNRNETLGRPALACTARRAIVSNRIETLESCGLKLDGLQADVVALANFAFQEFADLWSGIEEIDSEADLDNYKAAISKSVVLIDAGASSTNLVLVSGEAYWWWTVEIGGADLTSKIATSAKKPHGEAEKLKRNPAALLSPATEYQSVESRLDELRIRLTTVFAEGLKQDNPFNVSECWCMGGAVQTHQWIRKIMLKDGAAA